jgi:hypothetical protein
MLSSILKELNGSDFDSSRELDFIFPTKHMLSALLNLPFRQDTGQFCHPICQSTTGLYFEINYLSSLARWYETIALKNTRISKAALSNGIMM